MKKLLLFLALIFSVSASANESRILKYHCNMNKSEELKVYLVNDSMIYVAINHFLYGESDVIKLNHPQLIEYGNVMMVSENYGRSGYFFMRFEDGKKASEHDLGDALGMIDDNRFNIPYSLGYESGSLSALANCSKAIN